MEDLEPQLRTRLPDLDARVASLDAELGGLLDRPALLLMLADEVGLLPAQTGLAEFGALPEQELAGVLERLTATRTFRRADGTVGFVADADVRTPAGLQRVVLWDEAVRRVQGLQGKAVRITRLADRTRGAERALHTTRATEVLPG